MLSPTLPQPVVGSGSMPALNSSLDQVKVMRHTQCRHAQVYGCWSWWWSVCVTRWLVASSAVLAVAFPYRAAVEGCTSDVEDWQ